ncbi:MAG: type II secretion system protein M [Sterolibacterium sp.]|nr:type II secretion system protein M [Sterolibacterium sp.]
MKEMLLQLFERFDALSQRERATIAGAVLLGLLAIGYLLMIDPQISRYSAQTKRITQAKNELANLETQLSTLQAQYKDPDASNRAALQEVRKTMAAIDVRLRNVQDSLVSPDKMQAYLEGLLSRNRNLELVSLRTLPVSPLIETKAGQSLENRNAQGRPAVPLAGNDLVTNIYKHTIEMKIAGSYADLQAYLEAIESMPQRTVWVKAELVVEKHPRCVLTLTVYTLSLDKLWLVV